MFLAVSYFEKDVFKKELYYGELLCFLPKS